MSSRPTRRRGACREAEGEREQTSADQAVSQPELRAAAGLELLCVAREVRRLAGVAGLARRRPRGRALVTAHVPCRHMSDRDRWNRGGADAHRRQRSDQREY